MIDLDPDCNEALVVARYELRDGAIESLFADQPEEDLADGDRLVFFQLLRERVPDLCDLLPDVDSPIARSAAKVAFVTSAYLNS